MLLTLALLGFLGSVDVSAALQKSGTGALTNYCVFPPTCENKWWVPSNAEVELCPDEESYSGCEPDNMGKMYFCQNKDHEWVKNNDIISIYSDDENFDYSKYNQVTFLLTKGRRRRRVTVCDICSNEHCDNCCSENKGDADLLIDMEANTYRRFMGNEEDDGAPLTWTCLNCGN